MFPEMTDNSAHEPLFNPRNRDNHLWALRTVFPVFDASSPRAYLQC